MGTTYLGYRLLMAGIAVLWLVLLFLFQFRLVDNLGQREAEAVHHADGQ